MRRFDPAAFRAGAGRATRFLKAIANESRLMVLCELADGECRVGELALRLGLGQSALSQHLAKLRADNLVATRREGQTIYYRLGDAAVRRVMLMLADVFCPLEARTMARQKRGRH